MENENKTAEQEQQAALSEQQSEELSDEELEAVDGGATFADYTKALSSIKTAITGTFGTTSK